MQSLISIKNNVSSLIVQDFISSQDVRTSSKETYTKALRQFLVFLRHEGISQPTRHDILSFKAFLTSKNLSPFTISTYLTPIRLFFKWASSNGYYLNIANNIKGTKKPKGHRKDPLTIPQIQDLLASINTDTLQGKRDYAILNLMVRTGLRTIEIVRADIQDLKQESGEALLYIQGKGRDTKDDFVVLTYSTLKPIMAYLQARPTCKDIDPLFVSVSTKNKNQRLTTRAIRGIVKKYFKGIGLLSGRLSAHSLRHTAVTLSLLAGASLQETQAMARHNNINTTMIYAHNINRVANAPERRIEQILSVGG